MKYAVEVNYEDRCTRCGEFGYRCMCGVDFGYLPDGNVWNSIQTIRILGLANEIDIYGVYPHIHADSEEKAEDVVRLWDDGWQYERTASILKRS